MAAEVSSIVKGGNSEILITRDFLGGLSKVGNNNTSDLDLQVSLGFKRGMMYTQRCNSPNSPLSSFDKNSRSQELKESKMNSPPLKFLEESCLELKLLLPSSSSSSSSPPPTHYYSQSVCTLDKVKSALQRAEKEETTKKRLSPLSNFEQGRVGEEVEEEGGCRGGDSGGSEENKMFAAGCPGCLMYVMALKTNPKCPRCNSIIPSPLPLKKPRLDLNASL